MGYKPHNRETATRDSRCQEHEWRCSKCGKKLGSVREDRVYLHFLRRYHYCFGSPTDSECVCPRCESLNVLIDLAKDETQQQASVQGN